MRYIFALLVAICCGLIQAQNLNYLIQNNSPDSYKQREIYHDVAMRFIGDGEHRVYIFLPAKLQRVGRMPFVIFHHGWRGMNPKNFGSLIDHLARSGNVVIFPVYQKSEKTSPQLITDYAARADYLALLQLKNRFGISPDPTRVLYLGYSMGSAISLNLALNPSKYKLPAASALVLMAPGDAYHVASGDAGKSIIGPLSKLAKDLPIVFMAGDDDPIGLPTAKKLAAQACQIKSDRRALFVLPSDAHAGQKVHAGHAAPGAPDSRYNFDLAQNNFPKIIVGRASYEKSASLNQLDFYGYWKIIDAVLDGLEKKTLPAVVFAGKSKEQSFLGVWNDGTALKPMHLATFCGK